MSNNARKTGFSESYHNPFSTERMRDKKAATRTIEALSQNDQIIGALQQLVALQQDQNRMLDYLCSKASD